MKEIVITFITPITIVTIIFLCGLLSARPKNRIKYYFYALLFLIIFSTPLTSFILSYPLTHFGKTITNKNQDSIKAVIVLTGGIEKNILNKWRPSNNTVNRTLIGKKYSDKLLVPLVISGGLTDSEVFSEAILVSNYLNLKNSIIEQNSKNTYQSAKNLESFCKKELGPFLLITGSYHRLRSYLSFKSHECNVLLIQKSSKLEFSLLYPSSYGIKLFENVIYEYIGLTYYLLTNKIKPLVLLNI